MLQAQLHSDSIKQSSPDDRLSLVLIHRGFIVLSVVFEILHEAQLPIKRQTTSLDSSNCFPVFHRPLSDIPLPQLF